MVYVVSLPVFLGVACMFGQREGGMVDLYILAALVFFFMCYGASYFV